MSVRRYLDHAASSPLRPEARSAMVRAMEICGNPSSVHHEGRAARRLLEEARCVLASAVGVTSNRIVFTSGATEANAAISMQAQNGMLAAATEHPSVLSQIVSETIRVRGNGAVDLDHLEQCLRKSPGALVSVMAVNNETGIIQELQPIAEIVRENGSRLHVDAVQALGKLNLKTMPFDYLSLSGHKIGGPKGIGAIVLPEDLCWSVWLAGGGQEQRRRSGTENLVGICGFAAAVKSISGEEIQKVLALRQRLELALEVLDIEVSVFGSGTARAPHISNVYLPGPRSEIRVMQFDLEGIAVSAGSACSSGKVARSHVLAAMGIAPEEAERAIRISLGWNSDGDDIDAILDYLSSTRSNRA